MPRNQKCAGLMHMVANTSYISVAENSDTCYCAYVWIFICIGMDMMYLLTAIGFPSGGSGR